MRLQLAFPENDFVSPELYNELFTNHGSVTMFLVILPIIEGFAILLLPFLLGTREMPFPRLGAFSLLDVPVRRAPLLQQHAVRAWCPTPAGSPTPR